MSDDRSEVLAQLWAAYSERASAADAVYATLREATISGHFGAGASLIEEQLARQFGVSRTPVREALLRLEAEGFAVRIPRRGLVVRAISEREMLDLYTIRIVLDELAARLAATNALPSELAHLRWLNEQLVGIAHGGEVGRMRALSTEFHLAVVKASHNSLLIQFQDQIITVIRRFSSSVLAQPARTDLMHEDHELLVQALEARDAERAAQLAREHVSKVLEIRMALLRENQGPAGPPGGANGIGPAVEPGARSG